MKTKVANFNSHGHHVKAVQVGNSLLRSPSVQLVHVDEAVFHAGWTYFQQHQDKACLFTDCISFVMQKLGISTAFTSDKHFAQAGFRLRDGLFGDKNPYPEGSRFFVIADYVGCSLWQRRRSFELRRLII
jgi:hypothetical protein